jgi:hypothetical protein
VLTLNIVAEYIKIFDRAPIKDRQKKCMQNTAVTGETRKRILAAIQHLPDFAAQRVGRKRFLDLR